MNDEALGVTKDLGVEEGEPEEGEPQLEKLHLGEEGIGGAGESPQRRMEKPHGTQREHPIDVLQIIIIVRWGIHPMGQGKAKASLCPVILQLEEHPSGSKSKDRREAALTCPPLHWLKGIRQTRQQQHG